ncbi:MAG: hypothetical protein AMJ75_08540 [Phycisphaerae bacterium SM1_79]|nr:MAG: hypothetical protein AMJ75_08540 [Phycisphaerae bacterium SM1_79]
MFDKLIPHKLLDGCIEGQDHANTIGQNLALLFEANGPATDVGKEYTSPGRAAESLVVLAFNALQTPIVGICETNNV